MSTCQCKKCCEEEGRPYLGDDGIPLNVDASVTEVRYMSYVPSPLADRVILVDETKGE